MLGNTNIKKYNVHVNLQYKGLQNKICQIQTDVI